MNRRAALLAAGVAAASCRSAPPPPPEAPLPEPPRTIISPWDGTLDAVRAAVDGGRYLAADSILASFATLYRGTPEGDETVFWRALLRADPAFPSDSTAQVIAALDAYLASERAPHRVEAAVVRRLLALVDSLRTANAAERAAAQARDKARDEELQRLRDELQRSQAELERIKRRLGTPRP